MAAILAAAPWLALAPYPASLWLPTTILSIVAILVVRRAVVLQWRRRDVWGNSRRRRTWIVLAASVLFVVAATHLIRSAAADEAGQLTRGMSISVPLPDVVAGSAMALVFLSATAIGVAAAREWAGARVVVAGAMIGGGIAAAYGIAAKAGVLPPAVVNPAFPASPFGPFPLHGTAGSFLALLTPVALATVLTVRSHLARAAAAAVALTLVAAAFLNISRAAIVLVVGELLLFAAVGVVVTLRRRRPLAAAATAGGVVALLVAAASLSDRGQLWRRAGPGLRNPAALLAARAEVWRATRPFAEHAGLFGWGPGSFKSILPAAARDHPAVYSVWIVRAHHPGEEPDGWDHAYNDYHQLLIEWGWVGLGAWGTLFALGLRGGWFAVRHGSGGIAMVAAGVSLGAAAVLAHALVDAPLQSPTLLTFLGVLCGMLWSMPRVVDAARREAVAVSADGVSGSPAEIYIVSDLHVARAARVEAQRRSPAGPASAREPGGDS